MLVIANNISTRNSSVAGLFRHRLSACKDVGPETSSVIQDLAETCIKAGADVLEVNFQQHFDQPEHMDFAVKAIQQVTDRQICLSCNKPDTLEAGLKICGRPPIVNYVGLDTNRLQEIVHLAVKYAAEVVLLISDPAAPGDPRQMLEKAAALIGSANAAGLPNESIILDPGIFHITKEQGQHHLVDVMDLLRALPEVFDPPVRTTCWISNSSAGAPARLRPVIENSLLALLSGIGLSSVFMDVLKRENRRAIRLLKIFNNEEVYADDDLSLLK
jgi:5-methyltetrahydrofolate corrinoid/iron sulfur protein methyltransferase